MLVFFAGWFFLSCSPSKCLMCELDNRTIHQVDLNDDAAERYGKERVFTYFEPLPVRSAGNRVQVYLVDCEETEPYRLVQKEEKEKFIRDHLLIVDSLDIESIRKTSDTDLFSEKLTVEKLLNQFADNPRFRFCQRIREPLKIEIRGMTALRTLDSMTLPIMPGDIPVKRDVLGFSENGTMMTLGLEAAFLPSVFVIDNKHRFNLGLLTGYWPVDGGHFVPLAIHPRFTFNDLTHPLWGNCHAGYLFADLGTAYDISGPFDKFWSNKLNAFFWDIGAGWDFGLNRNLDLSVDLGYRQTVLPLLSQEGYAAWLECLKANGIPYSDYPRRRSGQLFLRVGVTF
ncbi:MAG TPA: hypothetical protein PLK12_04890 [Prolixibacteraceae bacterium]|nr:hypothetical protein [Prolixibacteraceae bacterium]